MSKYDNKSNDGLISLLKDMEETHETIKRRMLNDFTNLEIVERDYAKVKKILKSRLNNE